jgi:tetratricopeptide (TPR) repeat protein
MNQVELNQVELNQLGSLLDAERYGELEIKARELLELYPGAGIIWQVLGISLTRQGKDSLQAQQMAAQLLPKDAGAHNNLANALGRLGRLDEAVTHYRCALQLRQDFSRTRRPAAAALPNSSRAMRRPMTLSAARNLRLAASMRRSQATAARSKSSLASRKRIAIWEISGSSSAESMRRWPATAEP